MYVGYICGTEYTVLQVLYKAFYECSIGPSTRYSIGYSVKYIQVVFWNVFNQVFLYSVVYSFRYIYI